MGRRHTLQKQPLAVHLNPLALTTCVVTTTATPVAMAVERAIAVGSAPIMAVDMEPDMAVDMGLAVDMVQDMAVDTAPIMAAVMEPDMAVDTAPAVAVDMALAKHLRTSLLQEMLFFLLLERHHLKHHLCRKPHI